MDAARLVEFDPPGCPPRKKCPENEFGSHHEGKLMSLLNKWIQEDVVNSNNTMKKRVKTW